MSTTEHVWPLREIAYHGALSHLRIGDRITGWLGDDFATVTDAWPVFRDNFGGTRQNFRALGVNGLTYSGTAYLTAGTYVRMRVRKESSPKG